MNRYAQRFKYILLACNIESAMAHIRIVDSPVSGYPNDNITERPIVASTCLYRAQQKDGKQLTSKKFNLDCQNEVQRDLSELCV